MIEVRSPTKSHLRVLPMRDTVMSIACGIYSTDSWENAIGVQLETTNILEYFEANPSKISGCGNKNYSFQRVNSHGESTRLEGPEKELSREQVYARLEKLANQRAKYHQRFSDEERGEGLVTIQQD